MKTEIEKFRRLVKAQDELIKGYCKFDSAMPFCIGDMIEGYDELIEEIDTLKKQLKENK